MTHPGTTPPGVETNPPPDGDQAGDQDLADDQPGGSRHS
jgi:hypothetical protein